MATRLHLKIISLSVWPFLISSAVITSCSWWSHLGASPCLVFIISVFVVGERKKGNYPDRALPPQSKQAEKKDLLCESPFFLFFSTRTQTNSKLANRSNSSPAVSQNTLCNTWTNSALHQTLEAGLCSTSSETPAHKFSRTSTTPVWRTNMAAHVPTMRKSRIWCCLSATCSEDLWPNSKVQLCCYHEQTITRCVIISWC